MKTQTNNNDAVFKLQKTWKNYQNVKMFEKY